MTTPLRVAVQHVGCKLNLYEAEAMRAGFHARGCELVPFDQAADVFVVNTCTVTGSGDADSRRFVRRARRDNPDAVVVATGCYAQRRADELTDAGASVVVGNGDKAALVSVVLDGAVPSPIQDTRAPTTERFLDIEGAVDGGRTRGTLQIQDGCDEHCTFCIIPTVRGPGSSRAPSEILAQAQRMVDAGYRELALTGVHSGSYQHDEAAGLVDLLVELEQVAGLERIRLNSVEPGYVSDDLIDYAASSDRFCRHFHIPLQSGNDRILKRMGRHYATQYYRERIETIHERIPGSCLGADVMVGFPGETAEDHAVTRQFVESLPLTYLHVFSYSRRADTPADRLGDHVTRQDKSARARELIGLGQQKRLAFHQQHVGTHGRVLVETIDNGLATGLTDNYIRVHTEAGPLTETNRFVQVEFTQAREDVMFGERVPIEQVTIEQVEAA